MRGRPLLLFCSLALIWGTTWLGIKFVVREMPALSAAALRFFVAALLLAAYAWLVGLRLGVPVAADRRVLARLAVAMIGIPYALIFYGEKFISSALTAILFACHPACTLLVDSRRTRRNLFTPAAVAGLVTSAAGLWMIFAPRLAGPKEELRGMAAVLLAAVVSSWAVVTAKYGLGAVDPIVATMWQFAGGAVFLAAVGVALERPRFGSYPAEAWLALAYLTVAGSCVGFVFFFRLLREITPIQASSLSFVTPVVAVFAGWLVLDEVLSPRTLLGAGAVLGGLVLLHRPLPAALSTGD